MITVFYAGKHLLANDRQQAKPNTTTEVVNHIIIMYFYFINQPLHL